MSAGEGRVGRFVARAGAGEHVVVAHGSVLDGELEHPVEEPRIWTPPGAR